MIVLQMSGMLLTVIGTIWSFFRDMVIIKYLLYIQASQMCLSNYYVYDKDTNPNFEGLNMLSTVFSVIFCILNCYLASLVIDDMRVKAVCTVFIFGLLEYIIIDTTFVWDDMSSHTRTAIAIAIIYTLILIPIFGKITNNIINETLAEAKISFQ